MRSPGPILGAVLGLALGAAAPAWARAVPQAVSDAPSAASVTIYRDRALTTGDLGGLDRAQGLALVTETRTVDVPAGLSRIVFRGVADTLVPETVALAGLPGRVVERNEDYDLLSPGSLVARSIGQPVRVVSTDRRTGQVTERAAILRSGPAGVVLDSGGQVQALGCGGVPERLVFDRVPEGLGDKATFSLLADVPKAGRYTVKLSYLATGFSWSADYVARIRPDGRSLDLSGWLTLANKSSAGFAQAPTEVVAGDLARDAVTRPPPVETKQLTPACWGQAPVPRAPLMAAAPRLAGQRFASGVIEEMVVTGAKRLAVQSDLGDYKLYTLPEPTTVAARQTKQVAFLDQAAVPFERVYVLRHLPYDTGDPDEAEALQAPEVVLRLANTAAAGLGKPLPAGTISALQPGPGGASVLAGQAQIGDTAVGLPLELTVGRAMDLAVTATVARDDSRNGRQDRTWRVSVANAKAQPVTFEFRERAMGDDFQIRHASRPFKADRGDRVWTLRLAPGERAEFSYEVIYGRRGMRG